MVNSGWWMVKEIKNKDMIKDYKDLRIWQQSMDLVKMVYQVMGKRPREELCSLTDQIKRAAVSIPSNIAEGQARGTRELLHFLRIAQGSLAELENQLILTVNLQMLGEKEVKPILTQVSPLKKQIHSLMNSLRRKIKSNH